QYFVYGEDVDLCIRAKRLLGATLFTGFARYVHRGGASWASEAQRGLGIMRGKVNLYRQHLPPLRGRLARFLLLWGVGLRAMVETLGLARTGIWRDLWRQRDLWRCGWLQTCDRANAWHHRGGSQVSLRADEGGASASG